MLWIQNFKSLFHVVHLHVKNDLIRNYNLLNRQGRVISFKNYLFVFTNWQFFVALCNFFIHIGSCIIPCDVYYVRAKEKRVFEGKADSYKM